MSLTARCFSVSDKHVHLSNVFWLSTKLQIKSLYSQGLLLHELKLPVKKIQFFTVTKFCTPSFHTGKMLFADASKIMRNWFFVLQPDIFLIVCNLPKRAQEVYGRNMSIWRYIIYLFLHSFMNLFIYALVSKKKKLH